MTTIICFKTNKGVLFASDGQITEGNLKMPFHFRKIQQISPKLFLASAGSVGLIQQLSRQVVRQLRISKAINDEDTNDISIMDFVTTLAEFNFLLPLEFKTFQPSEFLVSGLDQNQAYIFHVGLDGSMIEIPSYWSIGSGSQLALSLLSQSYNENLTTENAFQLGIEIFKQVSGIEIFTNNSIEMWFLNNEGELFYPKLEENVPPKKENAK